MRYGLFESNEGLFGDRTCFPAQSSVLDEEALLHRIVPEYDVPAAKDCRFFSRGDSDIYQVHTIGPTFYLKVYRPPYTAAQAEAEARLVADLKLHGASVVAAVRRQDGVFASEVVASEGQRPMLLFEEAPPVTFAPVDEGACRQLGIAVAQLHSAGDSVACDCATLFEPASLVPYVRRLAYEEDYVELESLREKLVEQLCSLQGHQKDGDVGWCHCDLVLSNIRCRQDGTIVFFDFGNAALVSRAWELAGVRRTLERHAGSERSDEFWAAFSHGYEQVRRLPDGGDSADRLLVLEALGRIGWIGGVMASCPLRMGTETFNREWVRKQLGGARESVASILRSEQKSRTTGCR
jgi:Ser/Thr protein kinase RdoA (MazF antagonist)